VSIVARYGACAAIAAAMLIPRGTWAQAAPSPAPAPPGAPATASPVPAASATPAASPTSSAPSDPCTTLLAMVNRPTIGTGVCTVRSNHVLVETGYTNTVTSGGNGTATANYPQALIRVGTKVPQLDIEIAPPSYERTSGPVTGVSDSSFGAKYELGYTAKAVYGVNAVVTVPTGDAAFTAGGYSYTGNFNYGYTLSSVFSLFGTLGFNSFAAGFDSKHNLQRYSAFIPTLGVTASLPASSQVFAEAAYFSAAGFGLPSRWYYDFGYQKDLSSRVQVDAEYGFSPTSINGQTQHYLGAGISFYLGP
jgi:hypothetical protein